MIVPHEPEVMSKKAKIVQSIIISLTALVSYAIISGMLQPQTCTVRYYTLSDYLILFSPLIVIGIAGLVALIIIDYTKKDSPMDAEK
jgi:hypothetical protein